MENTHNNETFNESINTSPVQGQPQENDFARFPREPDTPQYNGGYMNGGYPPPCNPSDIPQYTPPAAYNSRQPASVGNQPYTAAPNTVSTGAYGQTNPQPSPSVIYNNTRTGNAPQYHYGNPMFGGIMDNRYYQEHQQKLRRRRENEKKMRSIGNLSGLALIACFIIASSFSALLLIPKISNIYNSGLSGESIVNLFYSITVIGGTFFVFGKLLKCITDKNTKKPKYKINVKFNAPKDPFKAVLLIFISFGGCMLANFISSFVISFFEMFGISSGYSSVQTPNGITDIILMFIGTALIPPLIEEYAMRGVLLSSLRKYGNVFAIIGSAYIFGIFHGNFTQIPFAFICGLFFAYAVIATDSLWTGIIIHALNNMLSCVSSILLKEYDDSVATVFFYACSVTGLVFGVLALVIYVNRYRNDGVFNFEGDAEELPVKVKIAKFLKSPAMIAATLIYFVQAVLMTTTSAAA